MPNSRIIPIQLMKGSKVVPLTPDEYARYQQRVMVGTAQTWLLTAIATCLFLSTFAVDGQRLKALCIFSGLGVAIAARMSSGEGVRDDRIAKDFTDGSDASRQSRIFEQTNIQQVPVESWYEALEEQEDDEIDDPHDLLCKPHAQDFIERFTLNRNSKLLVGAPGAGKTVTAKAWIATLFHYFPDALVLINYRKRASFCGLEQVPGCCQQSRQGDLRGLFGQMAFIHAIHQARSDMSPAERKEQPPAVFYVADYAATWTNISTILGDRRHPLQPKARVFLERMAELITVGRENNVQLVVDTQSFNLQALGNIDSNERGCLTTLGLGFESTDQWGQWSGNYEVLQLLVRNPFMISNDSDREQLNTWLPLMRDESRQIRQPLAFTTLGGAELFFLADYRYFEAYILPNAVLQGLAKSIQDALYLYGQNLNEDAMFSGSALFELGSDDAEPLEPVQDGSASSEPLNHRQDGMVQDSGSGSRLFTPRQIPAPEAQTLIFLMRQEGLNQTEIIERIWNVKKGGSKQYKQALEEYKFLTEGE
jgi:hypothetical protein